MESGDCCRRDKITPPDQRGRLAAKIDRPHLIERQADVITATRIIEDVSGLGAPIRSWAAIGCAESEHALFIGGEQFPKWLTPAVSVSRAIDQPRELLANLVLLLHEPAEFLRRPDRSPCMV